MCSIQLQVPIPEGKLIFIRPSIHSISVDDIHSYHLPELEEVLCKQIVRIQLPKGNQMHPHDDEEPIEFFPISYRKHFDSFVTLIDELRTNFRSSREEDKLGLFKSRIPFNQSMVGFI